jgi:flagellar biosynthesis protein FlhG
LFPASDPSSRSFMRLADALKQAVDGPHPGTGFASFWQRQFRQRQQADAVERKAQPAAASADLRGDMSQLKQLLLQQMERPDVSQTALAELLEALNQGYFKRFAQSAIDPLTLIDALIALPERNDHLLRDLAARLKPWRSELPTFEALVPETTELAAALEPELALPPVLTALVEPAEEPGAAHSALMHSGIANPRERAVTTARALPAHRYNEQRFGSQQTLLELLQQQRAGGESVMAIIEIMRI